MSPRDVELWDAFLSSVLKSSRTQDATRLEILKKIASEMAGEPYVLEPALDCVAADFGLTGP